MLRPGEDGRMLFFISEFLLYFVKCKWNRGTRHLLTKLSNFVQFNTEEHLFQYKVIYNDETIKI